MVSYRRVSIAGRRGKGRRGKGRRGSATGHDWTSFGNQLSFGGLKLRLGVGLWL